MAEKWFCDRCDVEITQQLKILYVGVVGKMRYKYLHYCSNCFSFILQELKNLGIEV